MEEELTLLKYMYYPEQYTNSMQSLLEHVIFHRNRINNLTAKNTGQPKQSLEGEASWKQYAY